MRETRATLDGKPLADSPTNTAGNVSVAAARLAGEVGSLLNGAPGIVRVFVEPDVVVLVEVGVAGPQGGKDAKLELGGPRDAAPKAKGKGKV